MLLSRLASPLSRASVKRASAAATTTSRRGGHWLHKNVRAEENAGLRELSYKTWDPSDSLVKLVGLFIVPSALVYFGYLREKELQDSIVGRRVDYGFFPPASATVPENPPSVGGH